MLDDAINKINYVYKIKIHTYNRPGNSILITSGFGIGLALMDMLPDFRYFLDMDIYRDKILDWETVGVMISLGKPDLIAMAGWFTIDKPIEFKKLQKGIFTLTEVYLGGGEDTLSQFINRCIQIEKY